MPHAVMGCKPSRVALAFLLFHVFLGASLAVNFVSEPPPTRSHVGDDITMEWTLNSDPENFSLSAFFNENNVRIISHTHGGPDTIDPGYKDRVSFHNTSSRGLGFRLTDVTQSDAGRYRCRYEPLVDSIDSSPSLLFIFDEPSTPVISLKRHGQISVPFTGDLKEGDSVTLLCAASSTSLPAADRPAMTYTWTRNGQPIDRSNPPDRHSVTHSTGRRLDISPVSRDDDVTYGCTAREEGSNLNSQTTRNLNVLYPPTVTMTIDPEDGSHGDRVQILCDVDSRPPSQVTWTNLTSSGIPRGTMSAGQRQHYLTLDPADCLDSGTIRCTADNGVKSAASDQRELNVFCPPESPEEFKVRDVTCASVTLQWEAGFGGGSPQTFHLSYRRSGATEWRTETVEDSGQDIISHKVNNLQEQTVYEFKLFAQNADGSTEDKALKSTAETTACLKFVPDSLEISIQDNIATISWQFTQRVDRVDVTCCNDPSVCTKRRVDQPTAQQPITMEVPPGSQNYIFTFTLFQDGELVFSSEITHYPASGNNAAIIAAVTTTVIVVIIVIVVVIVVIVLRRKRRVSKRDATPLYENTAYQNDRSATDAVQHKSTETGAATEFEASQVEIQTLLSDGTVFQVHSAQVQIGLSLHAAVIKRVKDAASLEVYSRYLADQMSVLLSLKHVNVVKLLGFQRGCSSEYENEASMSSLSLVLEPATQGDLHTFLTGHGAGVYQKTVTMETMMGMALGVATGAHALSDNKPAALHHYVCAKHVLVDDRGVCKLTGFSTAEAVRAREEWEAIHKSERPVRWMSAETLNHLEHTTKSDVWSFAIFLWELFSLGEMPYPELEDDKVQTAIQDGNRLEKPNNCDPTTYDLMAECWIRNTERRPGFQYVMNCLMKYQSEKTNASADEHTYEAVV